MCVFVCVFVCVRVCACVCVCVYTDTYSYLTPQPGLDKLLPELVQQALLPREEVEEEAVIRRHLRAQASPGADEAGVSPVPMQTWQG